MFEESVHVQTLKIKEMCRLEGPSLRGQRHPSVHSAKAKVPLFHYDNSFACFLYVYVKHISMRVVVVKSSSGILQV